MSSGHTLPVLPVGAGYGVVVGIGVSIPTTTYVFIR